MSAQQGLPPPVGGLNRRDSLAAMPATDAVLLENWIPDHGYMRSRGGYESFCSALGGPVESLMPFDDGSAATKFIAGANAKLWKIETGTAVELGAGPYANDRWQWVHFNARLIMCNGDDGPFQYDGTTLTALSVTNSPSDSPPGPADPTAFIGCNSFKGRMFYWTDNAQSFWFAQAGSFQGVLQEFNLGRVIKRGGKLVMMVTYTLDAGDGVNDVAVFVFSTGETVLYQGDDPESINAWTLIGNFFMGQPLAIRGHEQMGKNTVMVTKDAYVDMATAIQERRMNEENSLSAKIMQLAEQRATDYAANYGWQAIFHPKGNLMLINVPLQEYNDGTVTGEFAIATRSEQHVMNTNNGAWTVFTGWNAICFGVYQDDLYFGGDDGVVYKADVGFSDNSAPIKLDCIPAYSFMGAPGNQKQITAVRAITNHFYPKSIEVDGYADFEDRTDLNAQAIPPERFASKWDVSKWSTFRWGGEVEGANARRSVHRSCHRMGYSVTCRFRMASKAQRVLWYAWEMMIKPGGSR